MKSSSKRTNNEPTSERHAGIQAARGIAALLVLVRHSHLAIKGFDRNYWLEAHPELYPSPLNHLNFGVDIFFCISGYIMFMLLMKLNDRKVNSFLFLRDRVVRIYPLYWFFTILVLIAFWLSKGTFNVGQLSSDTLTNVSRVITSALLIPQKDAPILGVGWTLIHEVIFYFVCSFCILLNRRILPWLLLILFLVSLFLKISGVELFYGYGFSLYYLEFFLGAIAFQCRSYFENNFPGGQFILSILVYCITSYVIDVYGGHAAGALVKVLGFSVAAFLFLTGINGIYVRLKFSKVGVPGLISRIGDASYLLYLSHWFVLSALGKIGLLYSHAPTMFVACWHVVSIFVTILLVVVVSEKLEIPAHRWLMGKFSRSKSGD